MKEEFTVRRDEVFLIWFIFVSLLFSYNFFTINIFLGMIVGLVFGFIFLLMFSQRMVVYKEYFEYKTLFSNTKMFYKDIQSIFFETLIFTSGEEQEKVKRIIFSLSEDRKAKIPSYMFTTNKSSDFINYILTKNKNIDINEEVERLSSGNHKVENRANLIGMTLFSILLLFLIF